MPQLQDVMGRRFVIDIADAASGPQLFQFAAKTLNVPAELLKLVCKGKVLDKAAASLQLDANAIILAVPLPPAPDEAIRRAAAADRGIEDDEADLDAFTLPADARLWERALAGFLQQRLRCPDYLLTLIFQIGILQLLAAAGALALAPLAHRLGAGPVYLLSCMLLAIFANLGRRRQGEASAYSVFNNFQRLPGQLDADQIDQQVRHGQM